MQPCRIDHLTVVAPTLAAGAEHVERLLGVPLQPGGEHPRMGTHNRLLRLGDALFLEVIAPNPAAPAPARPRWFALDTLRPGDPPRLAHWVARTPAIDAVPAALQALIGPAEPMTRGALHWRITIPPDGALPLGGAAPALIDWGATPHPAASMTERGCTLLGLDVLHPDAARIEALLRELGLDDAVRVVALPAGAAPALRARIGTPGGPRTL